MMSHLANGQTGTVRAEQHDTVSLYRRVALWKDVIMALAPGKQEGLT